MHHSSAFILTLLCLILSSIVGAQQWQQTASSPKGSGITDLVVKQSNGYLFATTGSFNWPNADTGGVHRSTDGGDTWTRVFPAYIARMIALKQDSILFASVWPNPSQTERLYYSTDNGTTWTLTWDAGPGNNVFAIAFDPSNPLRVHVASRLYFVSNFNGGTTGTWSVRGNLPLGSWLRDIAGVFVAVQHSNQNLLGVYRSTDIGTSFLRVGGTATGDTVVSLIVVRDSSFASAGFVEYLILGTSNGKINKALIAGTLVFNLVHSIFGDPEVATFWALYAGAIVYIYAAAYEDGGGGGGVLQSIDRGAGWLGIDEGLSLPRKISALAGRYAGLATAQLYAGMFRNQNDGAPVYRRTIIVSDVKEGSSELPRGFALHQNYPNPFNPTTRIVYAVKSRESVSLKVYDVLGREVATLVNEVKAPGEYSVDFEGRDLSSGVYFYLLRAGEFSQTRKLVLLR
ncbi:MAG: hypothetical protein HW407_1540 [Bacteroidetes bacterium]|nr:hypothetical protein [Bacteroidota bacterium]